MPNRYNTISFLSDFGIKDEFVGVVHSVFRSIAPQVEVIDITHGIPAHDVKAGSLALARSVEYLCPGIVVAVVDPGVGTDRKRIAVEVGEGESILIGPDNGLLAPAVAMVGGPKRVIELTNTDFHLDSSSTTFDGRDVFAPAAAHLANGVVITELGESIDPSGLVPAIIPVSYIDEGTLHAEVLWIDQYGNIQLNIGFEDLPEGQLQVKIEEQIHSVDRVTTFDQIPESGFGLIVDSSGLIEIAALRSSAAKELRTSTGDSIQIINTSNESNSSTPVSIQPKKEN
ncbi:MAG TPA: SAM-dependent chlorinase/fluorinase [Acidimicrobiales bacterium]|nr:SAM-dependent chlorinase/fluorinase [Acidimicrobiales bacterium]